MKNQWTSSGLIGLMVVFLTVQPIPAQNRYVEDFSAIQYKDDSNTTAFWDIASGELKLSPFDLTLLGSFDTPGNAIAIATSGDYVYLADAGYGLKVIDISEPDNPTLASSLDSPQNTQQVAISGDYAYVAYYDSGLKAIDISDPTNPVLAGSLTSLGNVQDIAVSGDYAYVANHAAGLQSIDISDPTTPAMVDNYDTPGYALGVAVSGDYAYVADWDFGLQVIDISDPTNLAFAGSYDTPGHSYDVAIYGDYAYVADQTSGLQVININDPTNPTYAGSYDTPGATYGVFVDGDYVYLADHITGLQVIDITSPDNPTFFANYNTSGNSYDVVIAGNMAYVADGSSGLQVIKISDPVPPSLAGSTGGIALAVAVSGDYAYIPGYVGGLYIFNISDPTAPSSAGHYSEGGNDYRGVAISGDYAYVIDYQQGLRVLDISNPAAPSLAGGYDTPGYPLSVAIAGDYAYVADYSSLQVISISNPTAPSFAGSINMGSAWGVAISGNYAYVADGYSPSGLQVIDISNPTTPSSAGSYYTPGDCRGVAVSGDYAFVADGYSGLQVIDISDPTAPSHAGSYDTPDIAYGVAISGHYVYVAENLSGLQVIDISDPTSPSPAGIYDTPGPALGVVISGNYAYVADFGSLQVVEVFQNSFNLQANIGQSLNINISSYEIHGARLNTTQVDSISWELSADNGVNWESMLPGDGFTKFQVAGNELIWRSTHSYAGGGINPACSNLEIEWLYNFALIDTIIDVPDDQGGWARIYFTRSGLDFVDELTYPITGYYIFRRIDNIGAPAKLPIKPIDWVKTISNPSAILEKGFQLPVPVNDNRFVAAGGNYFLNPAGTQSDTLPPGIWEVVGSVPAHQEDQYICLVPTLVDSASTLTNTVYCISAETTTPSVFYFSPPDSGYSVDNISPASAQSLAAQQIGNHSVQLTWDKNTTDHDWSHYDVHRSLTDDFTPTPSTFLASTTDTVFIDSIPLDQVVSHYKVVTYDVHENPSAPSPQATIFFDSALPVFLTTLEAKLNSDGTVTISFSTAAEVNTAGFSIWRSESETEDFAMVASYSNNPELVSQGNSSYGHEYAWKDMRAESDHTYWYKLESIDFDGSRFFYGPVSVKVSTIPLDFALMQNFPNPFNPRTTIRYSLPTDSHVRLEIYDSQGQRVSTLVDEVQQAGFKVVGLDANSWSSGVYFYRLIAKDFVKSKRMLLIK